VRADIDDEDPSYDPGTQVSAVILSGTDGYTADAMVRPSYDSVEILGDDVSVRVIAPTITPPATSLPVGTTLTIEFT
jgi:hypothetical protein